MIVQARDRRKMWVHEGGWTSIDNSGNPLPHAWLADGSKQSPPKESEDSSGEESADTTDEESGVPASQVRRQRSAIPVYKPKRASRSKSKDFSTLTTRNPAASF
jgi:hypothetical protein